MGYQITYGPTKKRGSKRPTKRLLGLVIVTLIIAGSLIRISGYDEILLQFLLPGDPAVTAAALENMVQNLHDGENVQEAFAGFCREIIIHAEIY